MSTPNETAEAILIVIKKIVRWIVFAAIIVVTGFFTIIYAGEFWNWLTNERHAQKVHLTLSVAKANDCGNDYPYFYIIENYSEKTVEEVRFSVEVRKKGYSNKINSYTSITDSKILKSNEISAGCFRADSSDYKGTLKEKDVDFKVSYKNVIFEN